MRKTASAIGILLVCALALAGCLGSGDSELTPSVRGKLPDIPPTVPANLSAVADNATSVTLSWTASADDVEVAGYNVYRDGVLVGSSAVPGFADNVLVPDREYRYAVSAFDATGGESALSQDNLCRTKVAAWIRYSPAEGAGFAAAQASDNGIVLAGTIVAPNRFYDWLAVKEDIVGNALWQRIDGGPEANRFEEFLSIAKSSDGGYVATGQTSISGGSEGDVILVKMDGNGNEIWRKNYGTSSGYGESVEQTPDGGYIISGRTLYSNLAYLLRTDAAGNAVWRKSYSMVNWAYDPTTAVRVAGDNGFVFTYRIGSGVLVKTDDAGNIMWQRNYGSGVDTYGVDRAPGGYVVTGTSGGNLWLARTDSSGNLLAGWPKTYGGAAWEGGRSVRQTPDGGFVAVGSSTAGAGGNDIYIVRTDGAGTLLWDKRYGGTGDDRAFGVEPCADGGFAVAGLWTVAPDSFARPVLIKTDRDGNVP